MTSSILFVCTGNICRSPTAHIVMNRFATEANVAVKIDSAGTQGYHIGEAPDPRAQQVALAAGYDLSAHRARIITTQDFYHYDLILAMDKGHLETLANMSPSNASAKIFLYLEYAGLGNHNVPDPYYGTVSWFEDVLSLIEKANQAIAYKHGYQLFTHCG